jgi:serine/threonine protein kinase
VIPRICSANLLLNEEGELKVTDFGVSAKMEEYQKRMTITGSPYW